MRIKLRLRGFEWLKQQLNFVHGQLASPQFDESVDALPSALHEAVRLAARLQLDRPQCLPKSLALSQMLRARNYQTRVMVGVQKQEAAFASHAWLELKRGDSWLSLNDAAVASQDFTPI